MECNKDEATRAKDIAERKFTERNVVGAKKFALKAQNLFPGLEGLSQMLTALDVHLSAENKINGESDWYAILGVNPMADDELVKKQYRKLALVLHPDKNKSVGADGAFKLISEAWSVLSDKDKRIVYDQKRHFKASQQKVSSTAGGPGSGPPSANGFHSSGNNTSSKTGTAQKSTRPTTVPAAPRQSKPNTFWTACNRCKMQYEYLRVYLNHNLLCPNCHEPFLAAETAAPPSVSTKSSTPWPSSKQRQNSNHQTANKKAHTQGKQNVGTTGFTCFDSTNKTNFQWAQSSSAAAQAASVQAFEKVKKEREEAQAAAKRRETLQKRATKRTVSKTDLKAEKPAKKRNMGDGANGLNSMAAKTEKDRANVIPAVTKPNSTKELSQIELRNMLAEVARRDIRKKLNDWSSTNAVKVLERQKTKDKDKEEEKVREKKKEKETATVNGEKNNHNVIHAQNQGAEPSGEAARKPVSIVVPDPDFHDFDRERSERSFGENQVWAAYDDDDGMPRYYAMIQNVISLNPFKMRIGWLNAKTNSELGPINWVGSGFAKTCGDFRVGKYEVNNSLNSFSHRVRWTKGARGSVRIFPKNGDVWALYRNWSPEWNELTPDELIHKYDMVEVLDDYNEEEGVVVTPLVKVAGFKTVFHRHLDPGEVKRIPKEELFRFSHQVPSYMITGSEAQNAPKGCRELDPAATPLDLLQVITEVKEEFQDQNNSEAKNNSEANGGIVESAGNQIIKEANKDETAENSRKSIITEQNTAKETVVL